MFTVYQLDQINPLIEKAKQLKFHTGIDFRLSSYGYVYFTFSMVTKEPIFSELNDDGFSVFQRYNLNFDQLLRVFNEALQAVKNYHNE